MAMFDESDFKHPTSKLGRLGRGLHHRIAVTHMMRTKKSTDTASQLGRVDSTVAGKCQGNQL
ncbi:hypothetical protein GW7_20818 [Heterocephalus glaber]|uniref:Uncharacterized protein n=1 Tax=Heterocephalus glaber TaxID=10181 RepID=G5AX11_HETGA|nr:hypothetical protein GW7_20818 [Heterocephalus glaber]